MLESQPIFKRAALLVVAVVLGACGTGISVDPIISIERPQLNDAGDGGNPMEPEDASSFDDVAEGGSDASAGQDGASSDRRADASELPDGADGSGASDAAAEDGADDGGVDASVGPSSDAGLDRD